MLVAVAFILLGALIAINIAVELVWPAVALGVMLFGVWLLMRRV